MTLNNLASAIAKKEGKKSQVKIGDVREILAILSDMIHDHRACGKMREITNPLVTNGRLRAKKNKK